MKDLKSQKGSEESAVVDHKCVPDGQSAEMACPSDTHLSFFFYLLVDVAPPKTKRATA